ncbi:MAG: bifunctional phosphopantothenoylcysteine decarboxylase/phosphopantothenate--cysteine ligase CoaBC [Acidobacteriia bacterium]|nr:bifunctional phosphopantothenoylcysteine decarboxylase/phosphopantothenate--cysteine ligase CoaBC [Terriglobia bacterium]
MKIALGVTGCIAAYKAAELLRLLQQRHLEVQVVMTRHAGEFVAPLTFAALSGRKVITEMFERTGEASSNIESAIEHIAVAQSIDLLLVAPATANTIGKFARGMADDFLSTLYLATRAPVVVAPAMNCEMWDHPAVQENIASLRARGVRIVEPDEGYLACGMIGQGRLAANETILNAVAEALRLKNGLAGVQVLVTAGPTVEDIDPVRFISNRSSGKMGYALAEEAVRRGAEVTLISGPTTLQPPQGARWVSVRSAAEMSAAVHKHLPEAGVVVKAAAVADVRPSKRASSKIKKSQLPASLDLELTEDILASLGKKKGKTLLVGFAAESGIHLQAARQKLLSKNLDLLVVNDISEKGAGFDVDTNHVQVIRADGAIRDIPPMSKAQVAEKIFDEIVEMIQKTSSRHEPALMTK